jgi:hypothetical protein
MKYFAQIIVVVSICSGCSLLHHQDAFEMERLSEDVLSSKGSEGISIEITKIPSKGK